MIRGILVTGGSGYIGSLLTAQLLADTDAELVLPVRGGHRTEAVRERVLAELPRPALPSDPRRLHVIPLAPTDRLGDLAPELIRLRVDEIVHCAGSADYFDPGKLAAGNIDLTRAVVALGRRTGARRLVLISTAFSSGITAGVVPEALHETPGHDPNAYTASKRAAERLVADCGLPYLILRPSIVVGDSRSGRYLGPRFGLYQLWDAGARFLCAEYLPVIHCVAPPLPLPLVHQDALRAGFAAAMRSAPANAVVHLVSREATLPTVRDVYGLWADRCQRPGEVRFYDEVDQVPLAEVSVPEQYFRELADANMRISAYPWRFEAAALDGLRAAGLEFADATPATVAVCQDRFVRDSRLVQRYLRRYASERRNAAVRRVVVGGQN